MEKYLFLTVLAGTTGVNKFAFGIQVGYVGHDVVVGYFFVIWDMLGH